MISKRAIVIAIVMSATALFFQNCGKVGFNSLNPNPTLATQSTTTPTTPTTPTVPPQTAPTTPNTPTAPAPNVTNTNTNPPTTSTVTDNDGDDTVTNSNKPNCTGNESDDNDKTADDSDLVECDLGANAKVILNTSAVTQAIGEGSSNEQSTRVCMSRHACLDLVNAYAQTHNCSLVIGSVTTPNNTSTCTQIFPGSEGTCQDAQILSDNAVESILATMKTD